MNNYMESEHNDCLSELIQSADIKIDLEGWPCTVAVLGICAVCAFGIWVNRPVEETKMA